MFTSLLLVNLVAWVPCRRGTHKWAEASLQKSEIVATFDCGFYAQLIKFYFIREFL